MQNYTPGWRNKGDIADAIRGARLVMVEVHEVVRASIECRHRATVLCDEAQSLRAESLRAASEAGDPLAVEESSTNSSAHAA
jgi:hypothetical protein